MRNLLLVDGHGLLYRMFFGMPNKVYGKNNNMIQGTIGFIGGLLRVIGDVCPKSILVVFDSEKGSFRDEIDEGYKGTRIRDFTNVEDDMNPFTQLSDIKKALGILNIKYCEVANFEADDIISAYARSEVEKITIMTNDTDLLQLVRESVTVYDYRGKNARVVYDVAEVISRYGILPKFIPDLKSLVGDPTDNIVGIKGIGKKTATRLLSEFDGIDAIFQNIGRINPPRVQSLLKDGESNIRKNLSFILLDKIVPYPFELEELALDPSVYNMKTMLVLKAAGIVA